MSSNSVMLCCSLTIIARCGEFHNFHSQILYSRKQSITRVLIHLVHSVEIVVEGADRPCTERGQEILRKNMDIYHRWIIITVQRMILTAALRNIVLNVAELSVTQN